MLETFHIQESIFLQRRKSSNKPRDASTPHGSTAAESVRNLLKKNPKYSKRINYDALDDIFRTSAAGGDNKGDEELYTFDDKSDGEGMILIEEGGGGVGETGPRLIGHQTGNGGDFEGEEGSEKGDDYAWEDTFEQEV
jgi:transcription factor IIIB subunit 2